MNLTASIRRVAVVSLGCLVFSFIAACAGTLSDSTVSSSSDSIGAQSSVADTAANQVSSRVLLPGTGQRLGIDLIDGKDYNQLVVRSSAGSEVPYEVHSLSSPARIVLDLMAPHSTTGSRSFNTSDSEFLSGVRLGSYPEKTRIVLDLASQTGIEHKVDSLATPDGKDITITLAKADMIAAVPSSRTETMASNVSEQTIAAEEPKASFSSVEATAPSEEKAAIVESQETISNQADETIQTASEASEPKQETVVSKKEAAAPVLAATKLTSVQIIPQSATENILVAELSSGNALADLTQSAPSEYVLTLRGAALADTAASTLLAPAGSGAIRSVRPISSGDNIALRIFTTPEKTLALSGTSNRLIVSAQNIAGQEEARAQMAEETAAKPKAKGETAKAAKDEPAAATATAGGDEEISALLQERPKYTGRLISLDLQDTDIDNALRIIAEVSNLNIIASQDVAGKVTLRLNDVPWDQALDVILKTNGLDKVQEGNVVRIAPVEKLRQERESLKQAQQAEEELEPLQVRYVRISYAKAAGMKSIVESVLSERGSVTYDERTNQLIVKDIKKGIQRVAELVAKLDLRTPQVLLETQIIEGSRSMVRNLGSELGFTYVQSPATGNATGHNFPNAVNIGGSVTGTASGTAVSFPAPGDAAGGSAISFLLDSADGTKNLAFRLSALETEGKIKIVSRPSVATTNNKEAEIKSVEKIRIKTPSGGLSVATGQGASASGSSATATEVVEIGIVLKVTPQASPDYFVLLDIDAKSSNFGTHPVDGIPSEIERSATSSVLVSSGQTFAMGGIYKMSDNDALSGVPFLKDIPAIGHLFRSTTTNNSDEELLFFITPRIVEGSFDDAAMRANS